MSLAKFPIGSRVRVVLAPDCIDPKAHDVVGAVGTVTAHQETFDGCDAFLVVTLDGVQAPDHEWWFEPDEVEPAS